MNPEMLLDHFERLSEAPNAISHLRKFVIELSVRGRLVQQNPGSEQVTDSYICEPVADYLPRNWRLLNFGKFCDIQGGNQPPKSLFVDSPQTGYIRLFQIRDLGDSPVPTYIPIETTNRFCHKGEILIGRYGASVGKVFWAQNGAYNVALAKFIYPDDAFDPEFAFLVLNSDFFQSKMTNSTRSAQAGFNKGDLAGINLPLAPIPEQRRIVARLKQVTSLCDRLEAAQREQGHMSLQFSAASLRRINEGTNEILQRESLQSVFKHFSLITTHPDQMATLRATVLNLAIRGRLVLHDPKDESARDLLKRIQTKKVKYRVPPSGAFTEPFPFDLPPRWQWIPFGQIITDADAGWSPKSEVFPRSNDRWGVLKVSAVSWDRFLPDENKQLLPDAKPPKQARVRRGDFLISRANTSELVAKSVVVKEEPRNLILSDKIVRLQVVEECSKDFYSLVNNHADYARAYYAEEASGTSHSMKNVSREVIYNLPVPLPPAAEQYRIVAKVEELMALCDRLEKQLTRTESQRTVLLESILHNALIAPDELQNTALAASQGKAHA